MPQKSAITKLPKAVKEWLDNALIEANFSDYSLLVSECKKRGIEVSRSGLARYGSQFEKNLAAIKLATEQAVAITNACPDDENALSDALIRVIQEKAFSQLMTLDSTDQISLDKLAKIATDTAFAGNAVKEFRQKVKTKAQAAATAVAAVAKKGGLSADQISEIKRSILEIAK